MLARLTADHAVSVTAKSDITDLNLTLLAGTVYAFEYDLRTTANAATVGVQFEIAFSGTVTRLDADLEYWSAVTTKASLAITGAASSPQAFAPIVSQGNVAQLYVIRGLIEVGASGGTLTLRHGSETASLTTVLRGGYVVALPVT